MVKTGSKSLLSFLVKQCTCTSADWNLPVFTIASIHYLAIKARKELRTSKPIFPFSAVKPFDTLFCITYQSMHYLHHWEIESLVFPYCYHSSAIMTSHLEIFFHWIPSLPTCCYLHQRCPLPTSLGEEKSTYANKRPEKNAPRSSQVSQYDFQHQSLSPNSLILKCCLWVKVETKGTALHQAADQLRGTSSPLFSF